MVGGRIIEGETDDMESMVNDFGCKFWWCCNEIRVRKSNPIDTNRERGKNEGENSSACWLVVVGR